MDDYSFLICFPTRTVGSRKAVTNKKCLCFTLLNLSTSHSAWHKSCCSTVSDECMNEWMTKLLPTYIPWTFQEAQTSPSLSLVRALITRAHTCMHTYTPFTTHVKFLKSKITITHHSFQIIAQPYPAVSILNHVHVISSALFYLSLLPNNLIEESTQSQIKVESFL